MAAVGTEITIIDGGMGKELLRIGAPFRQPEWSALALMEAPEKVVAAHAGFIAAGAEVVITNAYACVPFHLGDERFDERGAALAGLAAELARQAADEAPYPVTVAGSLPPLFGSYEPENFDPERAPAIWRALIDAQSPHVDVWIAETISSFAELDMLIELLADDARPFWAAMCVPDTFPDGIPVLRSGEPVSEAAERSADCDALLINCSRAEAIEPALRALAVKLTDDTALGAYANAFVSREDLDDYSAKEVVLDHRHDLTPEHYTTIVQGWVDAGATLVGGCCGIRPDHIAALSERFSAS